VSDVFSRAKRSAVMSRIRAKNTKPELAVRRALFALGFRYRLHVASLPGRPDIVMRSAMTVVEVKGCFWHGHRCLGGRRPRQNASYWGPKISGNIARDHRNERRLRRAGWRVVTIWECEVRRMSSAQLTRRMAKAMRELRPGRQSRSQR